MSLNQQQISSAPSIKACLIFSLIHFSSLVSVQQDSEPSPHQSGAAQSPSQNQEVKSQWNIIKQAGDRGKLKFSGMEKAQNQIIK